MSKLSLLFSLILFASCTKNMAVQPKFLPEGRTSYFADQRMMRPPVEGAIAVDQNDSQSALESGLENGRPVDRIQIPITVKTLQEGQTHYNIYCTPCHAQTGKGNGIVVQRGFQKPGDLADPKYVAQTAGELFRTVTFGHGAMAGYLSMMSAQERWATVAYVRALQMSQNFPAAKLEAMDRQNLDKAAK